MSGSGDRAGGITTAGQSMNRMPHSIDGFPASTPTTDDTAAMFALNVTPKSACGRDSAARARNCGYPMRAWTVTSRSMSSVNMRTGSILYGLLNPRTISSNLPAMYLRMSRARLSSALRAMRTPPDADPERSSTSTSRNSEASTRRDTAWSMTSSMMLFTMSSMSLCMDAGSVMLPTLENALTTEFHAMSFRAAMDRNDPVIWRWTRVSGVPSPNSHSVDPSYTRCHVSELFSLSGSAGVLSMTSPSGSFRVSISPFFSDPDAPLTMANFGSTTMSSPGPIDPDRLSTFFERLEEAISE